jgi:DnaK suppressor protein
LAFYALRTPAINPIYPALHFPDLTYMPKAQTKKSAAKKPKTAAVKPAKSKAKPAAKAKAKPAVKASAKPKAKPAPKAKLVPKAKPAPKAKVKVAPKAKPAPAAKAKSVSKSKPTVKPKPVALAKEKKTSVKAKPEAPKAPVKASKKELKVKSSAPSAERDTSFDRPGPRKPVKMTPFLTKQKERLVALRDSLLDSMAGVAKDSLRSRAEGGEASAFGMHQADAGSDAYDRDFALSLLSQEQDALYEIEEALKRIESGEYGICEMSRKPIMQARLEALPFARYTVECQAELEKQHKHQRSRVPVTSLFGLTDDESGESDSEETEETPANTEKE